MKSALYYFMLLCMSPVILPLFILFIIGMLCGMALDKIVDRLYGLDDWIHSTYGRLHDRMMRKP